MTVIVTIDGPGGVGKTTVGRAAASQLGFRMLPSGMLYRAMGWYLLKSGWRPGTAPDLELLSNFHLSIGEDGGVFHESTPLDEQLAFEHISRAASEISQLPEVREQANRLLRDTVTAAAAGGLIPGVILEGRDMGTVVFPEATHKFFLHGDPAIRAHRRFLESSKKTPGVALAEIEENLRKRDEQDESRALAPLKPAHDAIMIDTSDLTQAQVIERVLEQIGR